MHSILVFSTLTIDWLNSRHALTRPFFSINQERYKYILSKREDETVQCVYCFIGLANSTFFWSALYIHRANKRCVLVCVCVFVCLCLSCCTPLNQFQYYYLVCPFCIIIAFSVCTRLPAFSCYLLYITNANICTNKFFGDFFVLYIFEIYYFSASSRQI